MKKRRLFLLFAAVCAVVILSFTIACQEDPATDTPDTPFTDYSEPDPNWDNSQADLFTGQSSVPGNTDNTGDTDSTDNTDNSEPLQDPENPVVDNSNVSLVTNETFEQVVIPAVINNEKVKKVEIQGSGKIEKLVIPRTIEDLSISLDVAEFEVQPGGAFYTEKGYLFKKDGNPNSRDGNTYETSGEEIILVKASSNLQEIEIPDFVTGIAAHAFQNCSNIEFPVFPGSLKTIGDYAFEGCANLKTIRTESPLTSIGTKAFANCNQLQEVSLYSVETLGDAAFANCGNLQSFSAIEVKHIGQSAFYNCNTLKAVYLNSAESIGEKAFWYCTAMTDFTINSNLETIGSSAFYHCIKLVNVHLPDSVTDIKDHAFYDCFVMKDIEMPNVRNIGDFAFAFCFKLTKLELNDVISIGERAFDQYTNAYTGSLQTVKIKSLQTLGKGAFFRCTMKTVEINGGLELVPDDAFRQCWSLTDVTLPDTVKELGNYAFRDCVSLSGISIPNVEHIGVECFAFNSKLSWAETDSVISIGKDAFRKCNLTALVLPSLETMGTGAFFNCANLKTVEIGGTLELVPADAFRQCWGLTDVTLPATVTEVGSYAFRDCVSLYSVTTPGVEHTGVVLPNVKIIDAYAFAFCFKIPKLELNDVISIGERAFDQYTNAYTGSLQSVKIKSLQTLGKGAFFRCTMKTVEINGGLELVPDDAFRQCWSLTTVTLPDTVKELGSNSFRDCVSLSGISIPNVERIGYECFCFDSKLSQVEMNSVISIASYAFRKCNLSKLVLPETLKTIGEQAFYENRNLNTLTIPESLEQMGQGAFDLCPGFKGWTPKT